MLQIRRLALVFLALFLFSVPSFAIDPNAVNNVEDIALKGFDPVAYFVDKRPRKGDPEITSRHQGVVYEFVDKDHKDIFDKDPAKYVPIFAGFCAFGVWEGLKIDIDPHAYAINEGKLAVFFSEEARDIYQGDLANKSREAQAKWPEVRKLSKVIR
ncbi:MAG: tat pathway signal sequence domain protein [Beijerinckiaceae bacterium]|nr:tat pathway signal sequence domain protein [Beijerinckiaceae bacterium]